MRFLLAAALSLAAFAQQPQPGFTADSQPHPETPKGTLTKAVLPPGNVYPGVPHDYQVYLPANLDTTTPAPYMIFLDGSGYAGNGMRIPVIFDNLIARHELPPIVGIFVNPGVLPPADPAKQLSRFSRDWEYDDVRPNFSRFLTEELIPAVAKTVNLSTNPDDHAIAGTSTGAVGAFMAAWYRPDVFHRVLYLIGTFVDMRGANQVPFWIRKTEPKPLRIFLQDGSADIDSYAGNWPLQNQNMDAALTFNGYDHKFEYYQGEAHSTRVSSEHMPDILRWLWRDYPQPIVQNAPQTLPAPPGRGGAPARGPLYRQPAYNVATPDHAWQAVTGGYGNAGPIAVNKAGDVLFADSSNKRIYKVGADGKAVIFKDNVPEVTALRAGADWRIYAVQPRARRIVAWSPDGAEKIVAANIDAADLAITSGNSIYFTDPVHKTIGLIDPKGQRRTVASKGPESPASLVLTPDQAYLNVNDAATREPWSYQVNADGSLTNGAAFFRMETSPQHKLDTAAQIAIDTAGDMYRGAVMGIELESGSGRMDAILNAPVPGGIVSHISFGGPDRDWLYVTENGKLYRRQTQRKGAAAWDPVRPPQPSL